MTTTEFPTRNGWKATLDADGAIQQITGTVDDKQFIVDRYGWATGQSGPERTHIAQLALSDWDEVKVFITESWAWW